MLTQLCPVTYANVKLKKDANIAVQFERHDSDFGRLDRKPIEQVDWNKVQGFLLIRDNFEGGNTEC